MTWLRWFVVVPLGMSAPAAPLLAGCGSRTGVELRGEPDAAIVSADATIDRTIEAGEDGGIEAEPGFDAREEPDVFFPVDAIAPFDARIGVDSGLACPDGGVPAAYLLDDIGALYRFDPTTLGTTLLGTPVCGAEPLSANNLWTLSVSREGDAYIVYEDTWLMFKVDLATLACTSTPFHPSKVGITNDYSIAVSRTPAAENLFVYGEATDGGVPVLAFADLTSFDFTEVGAVSPPPPPTSFPADMQADIFGHLFGLGENGLLFELEAATGVVLGKTVTGLSAPIAWAVMTYEDSVYMFWTRSTGPNTVLRYDVGTGALTTVGTVPVAVVGASAVPCGHVN